ncbi:MAG: ribosomal protein S18-alanine N-acetyltransferase [Cyanobacteriota bacterium]
MSSPRSTAASPAPAPAPAPSGVVSWLGPDDLADCLALDRLALGGLWSERQWHRELIEPGRPVVGVRDRGHLVALASGWLVVDELHITAIAVHPHRRRQGLGRQVLRALLHHAMGAGADRATLEVARDNAAAIGLYTALEFREVGVRRGYYRNGDDALILWRKLLT